jgi:hypothetical protein
MDDESNSFISFAYSEKETQKPSSSNFVFAAFIFSSDMTDMLVAGETIRMPSPFFNFSGYKKKPSSYGFIYYTI